MSVEEIKKALEGVTPDRLRYEADAMFAAIQGEQYGDTFHAYNWADKPHRVLYDAIDLMRNSASTVESLQRENEELRHRLDVGPCGEDAIDVAESAADHLRHRAEAAEAGVNRLREALEAVLAAHDIKSVKGKLLEDVIASATERARTALASTGGEHHAE